jgi:hypothetical protein
MTQVTETGWLKLVLKSHKSCRGCSVKRSKVRKGLMWAIKSGRLRPRRITDRKSLLSG